MAVPHRLSRKLREVLGTDAGEDLVTLLDNQRSESSLSRAELVEFRAEMRTAIDEIRTLFRDLESRLGTRISGLELRIAETKADLMKWSFVFWCGAVAAIAALAGVLRQ